MQFLFAGQGLNGPPGISFFPKSLRWTCIPAGAGVYYGRIAIQVTPVTKERICP